MPVDVVAMPPRLLSGYRGARRQLDPRRQLSGLAYAARLARQFLRTHVDVVHSISLRSCVLGGIAARIARLPNVWHIQCVVEPPMVSASGARALRRLARWLPDHVVFNSQAAAAAFDLPPQRSSVIPVGVDPERFMADDRCRGGRPRVGMIARIAPLKGQHVFIEAARQIAGHRDDVEFLIAGSPLFGEEKYAQQVQMQANGCEQIRFLGFVDDVPALLSEVDVVVHASVLPEAFGQVVVEAMLAGKPVVATALGGPVEIVEDAVTGVLIPPGDVPALRAAIESLLSAPTRAAAMGRRGRELALARYSSHGYARQVESVYERVLSAA
jgi:glycosyltransferase involved in cell wall biosynthesis